MRKKSGESLTEAADNGAEILQELPILQSTSEKLAGMISVINKGIAKLAPLVADSTKDEIKAKKLMVSQIQNEMKQMAETQSNLKRAFGHIRKVASEAKTEDVHDDDTPEEDDEMLKDKISEIMHGDDDEATKLEAIREAIGDEAPAEDDEMDSGTEPDDEDEMSAMEDDDEKTEEEDEDDDAVKEAEDDGAETAEDDEEDEDKLSEAEGDEDDEDDEEEDTPEGYRRMRRKLKKMKESLRTFQKDSHARKALESVGLKPTARLIEDLRGMAPAAIIRHAKRLAISERATKPRSSGYTGNTNSKPGFDINSILN